MEKPAFFNEVRSSVFGGSLTASQVSGIELILAEADKHGVLNEYLSYALATTAWETGRTMQPIHERGARSYFDKYEPGTKIGKVLGNTKAGDGYLYRGRGFVQLTGRANYEKAGRKLGIDLVGNPDLALQPDIAAKILFAGMGEGWFTGKSFGSYLDGVEEADDEDLREFTNARRIINGTDKAAAIAAYALSFKHGLRAAKRGLPAPGVVVTYPPAEATPAPPVATPAPKRTALARIVDLVVTLLRIFLKK